MEKNYDFLDTLTRGQYFEKKVYQDDEIKTYEEVKDLIPKPIFEGKEDFIACYDYAVKILFKNTHKPTKESGYVSNFVDAAFNDDIFLWDTAFMTLFCNLFHPYIPGIRSQDNFYCKQFDDGEIPREMVRDTGKDMLLWVNAYDKPLYSYFHNHYGHRRLKEMTNLPYEEMYKPEMGRTIEKHPYLTLDNLNHPILAFSEWQSYCFTKDAKRLKLVFEPLYQYYQAMKYHLRHANGLYVTDWASMDNNTRNAYLGVAVDTSAEMVLFAQNLLSMINVIKEVQDKDSRVEELQTDAAELTKLINEKMWNEEDGFYYDLTFAGEQVKIKTAAAFWTLISGVADEKQAKSLTKWLNDKDTFNRPHRVPVLAANEPGYNPEGGYWRGSVWAPMNAMVIIGLEHRGYHELAKEIALNHLNAITSVFKDTGTIWENYPADSITSGDADKYDFVGWSGIGPILYLIEYAIGLSVEKDGTGLVWEISKEDVKTGKIGCEHYWFAGHTGSFKAYLKDDKLQVDVVTKDSFTMKVIYGNKVAELVVVGNTTFQL